MFKETKTHCCIAADSYNVGALIGYIYNENINLVEIRHKGDVVGQAFVYMVVSAQKIMYRYEKKHHIFMVIDNVEINNNYAQYAEDIAIHLQKFMAKCAEYVSPGISDILLGTNYNDINPPRIHFQLILISTP